MKLLVTRPEIDAITLSPLLADLGAEPVICPLIKIVPRPFKIKNPKSYQAVVVTSSNSIMIMETSDQLARIIDLPLYAVGDASARTARSAGFKNCFSAEGDLDALCALVLKKISPEAGPLLYLSGEVISGDLKSMLTGHGYLVERVALYGAVARESLPDEVCVGVAEGYIGGAVFYSKRTAKIFTELLEKSSVCLSGPVKLFCLSQAVAAVIEEKISSREDAALFHVEVSPKPDQASMLALISQNIP